MARAILNEVEKAVFGDKANFQARSPLGHRNAIARCPGRAANSGSGSACPRGSGHGGEPSTGTTGVAPDRRRAARSRSATVPQDRCPAGRPMGDFLECKFLKYRFFKYKFV